MTERQQEPAVSSRDDSSSSGSIHDATAAAAATAAGTARRALPNVTNIVRYGFSEKKQDTSLCPPPLGLPNKL